MARKNRGTEVLEQGNVYFLYQPKVEHDEVHGLDDVERFHVVMKPQGRRLYRLLTIGRKRLPDVGQHERNWGFVEQVSDSPVAIEQALRESHYQTKTRGRRQQPAARPAAEGVYALVGSDRETRFVYALELPEKPGEPQQAFNLAPDASFVISVKNPERSRSGRGRDKEADFPKVVKAQFAGRRFAAAVPEMLNYEGAEIVLIGAHIGARAEQEADLETASEQLQTADIVRDLRMVKSRHPVKPLLRGQWQ
ncbi:hypothetical protein CAI21_05665 [Alkalilimnicola ehrlichii]|uniref:Uncharacterized protein n=1 Tax=Alkalilimnicola ehrlichii TaxID=351052 RepID=A0A3E0WYK4_9GAMM|nr:hypothetical protein [Alkalilimnicola ehrlichii]RFA30533.1 hypothetical protein CAI21_05665 [Alkalilimnicola ehrlichii]RFA38080.1 hypothetical protein CAL65_07035 [Alkalilimnicola ehrlichii]